ncbi:MAG: phosphatidylinositol dimannoside acyltransferase [Chthoniobacter sp.]|nr:phosphatidylinositol dimannoside acyltransferase [Chthoniobacter sp.]
MNPLYRLGTFRSALALAQILPREVSQELAAGLGTVSYHAARQARRALRANLALATGRDGNDLDELCRSNFANFVKMLADYFYCSLAEPARIRELLENWRGFEHLALARKRGKGGILVTAHLGNWELGGILLALDGVPLTVVTLEEPSSALTKWREDYRRRLGIKTTAVGSDKFAFVEIIAALRRNEFVAMLVDRPYAGSGTPVRFFGRDTQFSNAPTLLHAHTGAAVLPAFVLQTDAQRYLSILEPAIPMGDDPAANAQRIADVFEAVISAHPEQWYNYVPIFQNT